MFDVYAQPSTFGIDRRYIIAVFVAAAAYALLAAGVLLGHTPTVKPVAKPPVKVVFHAPPPAPKAPAPVPPKNTPVRKVSSPKVVRALVAPNKLIAEKPPEAEPKEEVAEVVDTGAETGEGGGMAGTPMLATPPPAPPVAKRDPINLPEEGVAPVADDGNVAPEYPTEARANGIEGQVILKIVVSLHGTVEHLEVLRGDEPFVAAAVAAVRTWKYQPAQVDGQPTAVFRIVKIPFRLRD